MEGKNPNCAYGHWDCMPCTNCDAYIHTKTNADRIQAMTDEELAVFIYTATRACNNYECESCPIGDENCPDLVKWLKQPAERGVENGETEQTENRP